MVYSCISYSSITKFINSDRCQIYVLLLFKRLKVLKRINTDCYSDVIERCSAHIARFHVQYDKCGSVLVKIYTFFRDIPQMFFLRMLFSTFLKIPRKHSRRSVIFVNQQLSEYCTLLWVFP